MRLILLPLALFTSVSAQAATLDCTAREFLVGDVRFGRVSFDLDAKTVRWTEGSSLVTGTDILGEGLICGDALASEKVACTSAVTPSPVRYQPTRELIATCTNDEDRRVAQGRLIYSEVTRTGRVQCQSFLTNKATVVELTNCL